MSLLPIVVGLTGLSRCGKDTVASILVEELGFEQRIMAHPIRQMLLEINPIIGYEDFSGPIYLQEEVLAQGWDKVKAMYPLSVEYMIRLGQSARDIIAPDVWLAPVIRDLPPRLVISDIRQPNEYEAVKLVGGVVWKIQRQGTVARGMDSLLDDREFDAIINNNGTIDELKQSVLKLATGRIRVAEENSKAAAAKANRRSYSTVRDLGFD